MEFDNPFFSLNRIFNQSVNKNKIKIIGTNYTSLPPNVPQSNDWFVFSPAQKTIEIDNDISISLGKISEIDVNQLEFLEVIGKGSFGQVWKGKWRMTEVAIKQIKQDIITEKCNLIPKNFSNDKTQNIYNSLIFDF